MVGRLGVLVFKCTYRVVANLLFLADVLFFSGSNILQSFIQTFFGIRSVRSHALNFRNVLYNMSHIIRMIFRRVLYFKLQFDRLDNLNIAKKVSKSKYCLHLHCFFHPSENPRFFFETRKSKL